MIEDIWRWLRHWKAAVGLLSGIFLGAAAVGSWLGATQSSPGARIRQVEHKVDSGFAHFDTSFVQLGTRIATTSAALQSRVDSNSLRFSRNEEKLNFLLRLGCRQIKEAADLNRACDQRGVH